MAHEDYLYAINLRKRNKAVKWIVKTLKEKKFDAIAISGFSGASIGSMVAYVMKKPLCYIRKRNESCASSYKVESPEKPIKSYIIVDDLISSGRTVKRIMDAIENEEDSKVKCLGACLYYHGEFIDAEDIKDRIQE